MRENVLPLLLLLGLTLSSSLTLAGCSRPCEEAANCLRTVDCLNTETDNRVPCTIAFRCEGKTQTCEEAFSGFSDGQICADYAARARCGVARCRSDDDCSRLISCPILDANNAPTGQFRDCSFAFACELDEQESCEPASSVDDATLCNSGVCPAG